MNREFKTCKLELGEARKYEPNETELIRVMSGALHLKLVLFIILIHPIHSTHCATLGL